LCIKCGVFERRIKQEEQAEFWVAASRLPKATPSRFYELIERTLQKMDFAAQVWALCRPAYAQEAKGGRPGIDPVVYLKMLMVGFFEDLSSERAIASRCADSLSVRGFLGYDLTEPTPEHSSLTVIRQRFGLEIYQQVFELILAALRQHGLLKGKHLGIDSTVMEANASLRSLVERNTEESYWEYVKRLAKEAGIDEEDIDAVRRFDRKRPGRKTSNQQWVNRHDVEAKVGKKKDGATDMIYKPENIVDLETGAIIAAEVLPGDQGDTEQLIERIVEAGATLHQVMPQEPVEKLVQSATADKGYFALEEIKALQSLGIKTIISEAQKKKRHKGLDKEARLALRRAAAVRESKYGKTLLRRRGQYLERSFEHILDEGGLRQASLRGRENLTKRYKLGAAFYNLSQLLRKLYGIGTARQWVAAGPELCSALFAFFRQLLTRAVRFFYSCRAKFFPRRIFQLNPFAAQKTNFSTVS
jgi:transposase